MALYALGAIAFLFAVAVGAMSTPWFRRALERRVIVYLEDLTGGRAEFRAMQFNPLILEVVLQELSIRGSEPATEAPLFAVKKLAARLSLVPLARRKLRLRALDWEDASIHVITSADGSTNFPGLPLASRPGATIDELIDLSVGRLSLARTQILWNDHRLPLDLEAQDVAVLLRDKGARRYLGSVSSSATRLRAGLWSTPPVRLTSQFELAPGALSVRSLAWQSSSFTGQCSFALHNPASTEGFFSFQISAGLPEFTRSLGRAGLRGGIVNLQGQGIYRRGEATTLGRIQARKLVLQLAAFDSGRVDLSADYRVDRRRIELTSREYELLEFLARHAGRVMSKEVIFEKVWGYDFVIESDAIKVYVSYLRKKLNAPGEPDLIRSVRGVGYMLKV